MILLRIKVVHLLYSASELLFKFGSALHDRVKRDMVDAGVTEYVELRVDTPVAVSEHSEPSVAGRVLLASLVGMSIITTWLWFVVRTMA